jgi:modulator of FtsH protease HflK
MNPELPVPAPSRAPTPPPDAGSQALEAALRSSFAIVRVVMVVLLLVFFASGFFSVGPQEKAIILRFGRSVGEGKEALLGAGLHWSLPFPIDEVVKVPITEIQTIESTTGWYATTKAEEAAGTGQPAGPSLRPGVDGYTMTSDGNIMHARATLRYRIEDPIRYVFGFVNASNRVQDALDNALLHAATQFKVDDALTRDVAAFKDAVRRRATEVLARENVGVTIEQCEVQTREPRQVKDDFAKVLKAEVMRSQKLTEAHSTENRLTNQASADAKSLVDAAESDRKNLVEGLRGEAARFSDLLPKYRTNRVLLVEQRVNETVGRTFTNVQDKVYVPSGSLRYLLLNKEWPRVKTETPGQP